MKIELYVKDPKLNITWLEMRGTIEELDRAMTWLERNHQSPIYWGERNRIFSADNLEQRLTDFINGVTCQKVGFKNGQDALLFRLAHE